MRLALCFKSLFNYVIFSSSIYKNSKAIVNPGNMIPTNGTNIDGKYADVIISLLFINLIKLI